MPKRASAKNEKTVVDYDQAREVTDLMRFATGRMPNYVETIEAGDAARRAFHAKARKWGLPRVLVFSDKAVRAHVHACVRRGNAELSVPCPANAQGQTSTTLKALSAEYRRRKCGARPTQPSRLSARRHGLRRTFARGRRPNR